MSATNRPPAARHPLGVDTDDDGHPSAPGGLHHVEHVMGMAVSFDVRDGAPDRGGLAAAVDWLHEVDRTFSTYDDDSVVSRLGRGDIGLDDAPADVVDVLVLCERLRAETGGAFDAFAVPAPNGTTLDPSGLVKGWSVERAAGVLEAHGHSDFTINAGGDIAVRGSAGPGTPWRVGIRHPEAPDRLAVVLAVTGPVAVATSATYERGAHIVDPRLGAPTTALASATVVGPDLTLADAYATAVFVMGVGGLDWLAGRPGYSGCVITHDAELVTSPDFDALRTGSAGTRATR